MFHPNCLVLSTPEVDSGAPVLLIIYVPEEAWGDPDNPEPGEFIGWMFLHTHDSMPDNADICRFEIVKNIDQYVEEIIEKAEAGFYSRESEFAPFEKIDDAMNLDI